MGSFLMGAVSAIGAGLSVISGASSLSKANKQAKREKQMIDAQNTQNKLQAQLQMYQLQNTRKLNVLQDTLVDAANKQAYMQTDAALKVQEMMNEAAVKSADLQGQQQQMQGGIQKQLAGMQAQGEQADARLKAGSELIDLLTSSNQKDAQAANEVMKQLTSGGDKQNTIARLLDIAASSGGVNEALGMLSESGAFMGTTATGELNRNQAASKDIVDAGGKAILSGSQLDQLKSMLQNTSANISSDAAISEGKQMSSDAQYSGQVAKRAFESQRIANDSNYKVGLLSSGTERQARYLTSMANEEALQKGAVLQSQMLDAQRSNVRSPGLFDYLGVGMNAYSTFSNLNGTIGTRSGSSAIRQGKDVFSNYTG